MTTFVADRVISLLLSILNLLFFCGIVICSNSILTGRLKSSVFEESSFEISLNFSDWKGFYSFYFIKRYFGQTNSCCNGKWRWGNQDKALSKLVSAVSLTPIAKTVNISQEWPHDFNQINEKYVKRLPKWLTPSHVWYMITDTLYCFAANKMFPSKILKCIPFIASVSWYLVRIVETQWTRMISRSILRRTM